MSEPSAWALERAVEVMAGDPDYRLHRTALALDAAVAEHVAAIAAKDALLTEIRGHLRDALRRSDAANALFILGAVIEIVERALGVTPATPRERAEPQGCPTPGACSCR